MGSNQDQHSECLFPFGDDFLPILAFFFNNNDPRNYSNTMQEEILEDKDPQHEIFDDSRMQTMNCTNVDQLSVLKSIYFVIQQTTECYE